MHITEIKINCDITLIFAVHERSSCRSLQHNFMPLREFIAFTKPIYSLYWIYASKTKSCPLPKNENVETPDMVDFIWALKKRKKHWDCVKFSLHLQIKESSISWIWKPMRAPVINCQKIIIHRKIQKKTVLKPLK